MTSPDEKPPAPQPVRSAHPATNPDARKNAGKSDPPAEEKGGPKGKEPTRYGDWENKGIAWDF
jgi:hypothetical protein